MVIQNVQSMPLAKINSEILVKLNVNFSSESKLLIFHNEVEIHINIPAPASEIILKIISGKPILAKKTKLKMATIVSATKASKMILTLFEKPFCNTSVKIAVSTGPGINPPINPRKKAFTRRINLLL